MLNLEKLVAYFSKKGADPDKIRAAGELINQQFPGATGVVDKTTPMNLIFFKVRGYFYYVRLGELVIRYAAKKNKGNAEFLYSPLTEEVYFRSRLHENHILWKKRVSKADKKRAKKYGKTREVVVDELLEAVKGGPLLANRSSTPSSDLAPPDPPETSVDQDTSEPVKVVKIETKEDLTKFQSNQRKQKKKPPPRKKKQKPKSATRSAF